MIEVRPNTRDSVVLYDTANKATIATFYRQGPKVALGSRERIELPMRDYAESCANFLNGVPAKDPLTGKDETTASLDELRTELMHMGVPVDKRWNSTTLRAKIAKAKKEAA